MTVSCLQIADKVARLAPEVRFLVVGDGAECEKIQTQERALGVLDRTFFMLKSLPKLETPALFAAATISTSLFVDLPEMWANSANKFFDALAAGKPIAINYKGWQADLLGAAGAGIVVPAAGEAGATAAAVEIVRVLHDPAWLERAGAASHELARTYFDRAMLARKLEQVLAVAVVARQRS